MDMLLLSCFCSFSKHYITFCYMLLFYFPTRWVTKTLYQSMTVVFCGPQALTLSNWLLFLCSTWPSLRCAADPLCILLSQSKGALFFGYL